MIMANCRFSLSLGVAMTRASLAALLLVLFLIPNQANAQGSLEIPAAGTDQSGIGVVSGWHCNADVIEISFDGGNRIAASYGTTRADTASICGDDDNGFALLWNYNLLGPGKHTATLYADGTEIATSVFTVNTLGAEFLRDAEQKVRVLGFPEFSSDVILEWQKGNQNFVVSDYLASRDSFNVTGNWSAFSGGVYAVDINIFTSALSSEPEFSEVFLALAFAEGSTVFYAGGAMQQNVLFAGTSLESGAPFDATFEFIFSGPLSGTLTVTECTPFLECNRLTGTPLTLEKFAPVTEVGVQSADGEEQNSVTSLATYIKNTQVQMIGELIERADALKGSEFLEGHKEQPKKHISQ